MDPMASNAYEKNGQLRLGIDLPLGLIPIMGSVYFATVNDPTNLFGRRAQFSHTPMLGRSRYTIADRRDGSSNDRTDPVASNAYEKSWPTPFRHRIAVGFNTDYGERLFRNG
jgi:hypothetical protein